MSLVVTKIETKNIYEEFNQLLNSLQQLLIGQNSKTKISSTKFGVYQKKIDEASELNPRDLANLIAIINRYKELNFLFEQDNNILFNNKSLVKIIEGKASFDDGKEEYNHTFFELSMAIRFARAFKSESVQIDLTTICDLIINQKIAIECKYIHSRRGVEDNIKKAIKQINSRVSNGLAESGIIALDVSNLVDREKIRLFSEEMFTEFSKSIEKLEDNSFVSEWIREHGVYSSTIMNSNFGKILQSYSTHHLEQCFYESLHKNLKDRLNNEPNVLAVIFQSYDSFCFKYKDITCPLPNRALTYFVNESLNEDMSKIVKKVIHRLAVGV